MTNESAVPTINMEQLLGSPKTNPEKETGLEKALSTITPEDAAATTPEQVKFQFRSMLNEQQLTDLKKNAPEVARKMIQDYNTILDFGQPVLTKMNNSSVQLLETQRNIKVPEADAIVNDLLREMDGFEKKYRNQKLETGFTKIVNFFRGTMYSLKTLARESKPIVEKLNIAETKLREMELNLGDNITRAQQLHKNTNETLTDVVGVLAALEEIIEVARTEAKKLDDALKEAETENTQDVGTVTVNGETMTVNELRLRHAEYANGVSELEKTWFDWRQQFFLGYAQAPSILNLILVSVTMKRRCQVFRTMGLPSARTSLAMWQQAALAQESAEKGKAVQEGTNELIRKAYEATATAVAETAMASQTPVVDEETLWTVIASIKTQCEGLVAADRWGREIRAKNLQVLEEGETGIRQTFTESRRQLVENAIRTVHATPTEAPAPDMEILKQIGVKTS